VFYSGDIHDKINVSKNNKFLTNLVKQPLFTPHDCQSWLSQLLGNQNLTSLQILIDVDSTHGSQALDLSTVKISF